MIKFWLYTIRATWRVSRGRWFIWRDAPLQVVEEVAELRAHLHETDDPNMKNLVWQACDELALRGKEQEAQR
jgi:hypothetical protein